MKRKLNKELDIAQSLQKFEEIQLKRQEEVEETRKNEFTYADELDTAFFFSVVFNTRKERDKWLEEHGIELEEDFFVKADNFIDKVHERRS